MVMRTVLFIVMLLVVAAAFAHGQLYQYVDKSGNTVYTDKPPHNGESSQKNLPEVYWSAQGEEIPAGKGSSSHKLKKAQEPKKNYNRVMVVMYMTDW